MNAEILKGIPLFSSLKSETLRHLESVAVKRSYPKNTVLISEGDSSDQLYVILDGKIKVVVMDPEGREVVVNLLGAGDCFGEIAMIDGETRSATIVTMEPTQVLTIGRADFTPILNSNTDLMLHLLKLLARKVRAATSMVESLAFEDVYARLIRLLTNLAKPKGNLLVVEQRLTHQEIANMIGSSREGVSRMLKALSSGGYISVDQKRICIQGKLPRAF
jgi:CRP/FNR family transcriptional regulator, cyclic AMP receptor protein